MAPAQIRVGRHAGAGEVVALVEELHDALHGLCRNGDSRVCRVVGELGVQCLGATLAREVVDNHVRENADIQIRLWSEGTTIGTASGTITSLSTITRFHHLWVKALTCLTS